MTNPNNLIFLPSNTHPVEIPAADGQPGLTLTWPMPTQPATDQGILLAESWLAGEADGYLWTRLVHGRIEHMDNWRRMAFEIGFLTRLQQRLGRMPE
ncbi:LasR-specific antiactivator QslA [Pseudomonas citronellolis]|uniref:LasR-specific antiactivator QslA n=1 Tax=Pseudomonas citronellolis TaxID=53408 RepID=UPI000E2FCAAB|nr:LasR-specific antiactivator QslA [Pseudomonas citronellolis]